MDNHDVTIAGRGYSVRSRSRDLRLAAALAFWIASTSSALVILDRPRTSRRPATSSRCFLLALASTPPAVGRSVSTPPAACSSLGPRCSFGSQWSPTFSNECLSDDIAVRCARSPSPYCSTALSSVSAYVSWACLEDRLMVLGRFSRAGMPEGSRAAGDSILGEQVEDLLLGVLARLVRLEVGH